MNETQSDIQFIDLAAQQAEIYAGLEQRIRAVLSHGKYIMGPEVYELEEELARYVGVKHTISCSSGTDALLMCLMAYGIGPGDGVFTTPFTFIATAGVIGLLGATPIFVDIEPRTFNLDPATLKLAIRATQENDSSIYPLPRSNGIKLQSKEANLRPRGIITVDLFGLPADYQRINAIAAEHGLFVIEDAAQSFGASVLGKFAGSLADVAATSFFPAKPLGCYGDGGAIFTDNDGLADTLQSIRIHGKGSDKYDNLRIGINGRLDTMQAAVLLEKLTVFPGEVEARNRIAARYTEGLKGIVEVPFVPDGYKSVWAQYSFLIDNRTSLQRYLGKASIPTMVYYPKPLHLQTAFSSLAYNPGDFPISEQISQKIVSLPMHPYLKDEDIRRITHRVNDFCRGSIRSEKTLGET